MWRFAVWRFQILSVESILVMYQSHGVCVDPDRTGMMPSRYQSLLSISSWLRHWLVLCGCQSRQTVKYLCSTSISVLLQDSCSWLQTVILSSVTKLCAQAVDSFILCVKNVFETQFLPLLYFPMQKNYCFLTLFLLDSKKMVLKNVMYLHWLLVLPAAQWRITEECLRSQTDRQMRLRCGRTWWSAVSRWQKAAFLTEMALR